MGRHGGDKRDRGDNRDKQSKKSRSPGKSQTSGGRGGGGSNRNRKKNARKLRDQGRYGVSAFSWHNWERELKPTVRDKRTPPPPTPHPRSVGSNGKLRVDREDKTSYDVHQDCLK